MSDAECDANVLIRYLLGEPEEQFRRTREYFGGLLRRGETLSVSPATLSDVVFVLGGRVYRRTREDVAASVSGLLELQALDIRERPIARRAVELFRHHHPQWNDCLIAAAALERGDGRVVSFDQGLDRIPGITRIEPGA